MARAISLLSSKGGTGKTTTTLNLGMSLADLGINTCIVDLDPMGSIGFSLAKADTEWQGLAEVFLNKIPLEEAILQTKSSTLSILPRGRLDPVNVAAYERYLFRSKSLGALFEELKQKYEYVILDLPSGLGMIPRAALAVSDYALITLQAEPLAMRTLGQSLKVVNHVAEHENELLSLLGILPTMVQVEQEESAGILKTLWGDVDGVFKTYIPRSEIFIKSSHKGVPATFITGPNAVDAQRYSILAREVIQLIWENESPEGESYGEPQRKLF